MKRSALIITIWMIRLCCFAQNDRIYQTWNPASAGFTVLEGQAWPGSVKDGYDRFPAKAQAMVREDVWDLSKNSAGLQLRFQTNADEIIVKFKVSEDIQMLHMPATGVSGIDLYSKTIDGQWLWAAGKYSFGDTVVYRFSNLLTTDQHVGNREYTLYFPLYNTVKWMEISVPQESRFKPLPVRKELPVVVYGTSIAQGACATRPGLAWTNILSRKLDRPVVNLGFSGNGRLETPVLDLMATVNAKLYVLDCLPNMVPELFTTAELKQRIVNAVKILQAAHPSTPLLFCDHDGFTDEGLSAVRKKRYQDINTAMKEIFDSLLVTGTKNIYRLSKEEIGQDIESMVDGVHPNDIGMMHYANACHQKISGILNELSGTVSTTIPVTQRRDFNVYDWETRHNEVLNFNQIHQPRILFIGNSITHFWGGLPQGPKDTGKEAWEKYFGSSNVANLGFGWDRIENVLWRVYHGELDSIAPKQIVLMIGTNNLHLNTDDEIVQGLQFLVKAIRAKQPFANILLMGILPRRDTGQRITALNNKIRLAITGKHIRFADAGFLLLKKNKQIDETLFTDGLHPNAAGYQQLGAFIHQQLNNGK